MAALPARVGAAGLALLLAACAAHAISPPTPRPGGHGQGTTAGGASSNAHRPNAAPATASRPPAFVPAGLAGLVAEADGVDREVSRQRRLTAFLARPDRIAGTRGADAPRRQRGMRHLWAPALTQLVGGDRRLLSAWTRDADRWRREGDRLAEEGLRQRSVARLISARLRYDQALFELERARPRDGVEPVKGGRHGMWHGNPPAVSGLVWHDRLRRGPWIGYGKGEARPFEYEPARPTPWFR